MPHRTIPDTDLTYALLSFDKRGAERTDDPDGPGGVFSQALLATLGSEPITDVFIFSHGWKGDVPGAIKHYDQWVKAMDAQSPHRAAVAAGTSTFRPLRIGLHWPSQPWGDEELAGIDDFASTAAAPVETLIERYVERLGDAPEIREALRTIFETARQNADADRLPPAAHAAYLKLNAALELGDDGEAAPPDADRAPFDPDLYFEVGQEDAETYGGISFGGILGPLRQLSFWRMKKRARTVGEGEMHPFLVRVQQATAERGVRIHLMGHSFGCIVVSAMLGGPGGEQTLPRPVDSVILAQGAVSHWAYCPDVPYQPGTPGYFHRIAAEGKVAGPILTTRSRHDTAVGRFYPWAAGATDDFAFAGTDFPPYGGIGAFGIQGMPSNVVDRPMLETGQPYGFQPGIIYNLEASEFISEGDGPSGAHSDIAGPQVAHAIWQAASATEESNG